MMTLTLLEKALSRKINKRLSKKRLSRKLKTKFKKPIRQPQKKKLKSAQFALCVRLNTSKEEAVCKRVQTHMITIHSFLKATLSLKPSLKVKDSSRFSPPGQRMS
jgi:hypothetical protein